MTQVKITSKGSSNYKVGQTVDYNEFATTAQRLLKQKKTPPMSQVLYSSEPIKVTFSNRYNLVENNETKSYYDVYIRDEMMGGAYLTPGQDFEVRIFLAVEAMPFAKQVLEATEKRFHTRNISITNIPPLS